MITTGTILIEDADQCGDHRFFRVGIYDRWRKLTAETEEKSP